VRIESQIHASVYVCTYAHRHTIRTRRIMPQTHDTHTSHARIRTDSLHAYSVGTYVKMQMCASEYADISMYGCIAEIDKHSAEIDQHSAREKVAGKHIASDF